MQRVQVINAYIFISARHEKFVNCTRTKTVQHLNFSYLSSPGRFMGACDQITVVSPCKRVSSTVTCEPNIPMTTNQAQKLACHRQRSIGKPRETSRASPVTSLSSLDCCLTWTSRLIDGPCTVLQFNEYKLNDFVGSWRHCRVGGFHSPGLSSPPPSLIDSSSLS
jgi:hypothetical protein